MFFRKLHYVFAGSQAFPARGERIKRDSHIFRT
jgi:hypothetical protein